MPINDKYLCKFEEGCCYHIYNRCPSLRKMFFNDSDYDFFLDRFMKYVLDFLDVYAYCLIPNHFHFFIRVKRLPEQEANEEIDVMLTNQFRKLFISYAKRVNRYSTAHGQVFCTPFKRIEITDDAYYTGIVTYIHSNPVHHEITKDLTSYKYSSYNAYVCSKPTKVKSDEVLDWFGGKEPFITFHLQPRETAIKLPFDLEY